jgi:hypothetical protein
VEVEGEERSRGTGNGGNHGDIDRPVNGDLLMDFTMVVTLAAMEREEEGQQIEVNRREKLW